MRWRRSPVHCLLNFLLSQLNQFWGLHACGYRWEASGSDQPTGVHQTQQREEASARLKSATAKQLECTCLLAWRIQSHLVSPPHSPPLPLPRRTPHLKAPVLPMECDPPLPPPLWPARIQTHVSAHFNLSRFIFASVRSSPGSPRRWFQIRRRKEASPFRRPAASPSLRHDNQTCSSTKKKKRRDANSSFTAKRKETSSGLFQLTSGMGEFRPGILRLG